MFLSFFTFSIENRRRKCYNISNIYMWELLMKIWNVNKPDRKTTNRLSFSCGITPLAAAVLVSRGFTTPETIAEKYNTDMLSDPFLIRDMQQAADTINDAIDERRRICIYGDYDCDGIMATVILYSYLSECGADVFYYIPERAEGYGLNTDAIDRIAEQGTELIITVDNGISAVTEAEYIYSKGMRLVITDHHQQGDVLPKAEAVVDPHRHDCTSPFRFMCGAGLALKLVAALDGGDYTMALEQFGDLAAIATIADIVSLSGENRFLVSYGLGLINNTDRPGLIALIEKAGLAGKKIDSRSAAFGIAPRINASGRFGSPKMAAELMLCEDPDDARRLAAQLDDLNNRRKEAENAVVEEIFNALDSNPELLRKRVIFVSGKNWHHGVIGIAAARILERLGKPVFIASEDDGEIRGSARSFGEFSVFGALSYAAEALEKFGGHPAAGGFTIKSGMEERFHDLLEEYGLKFHITMPVPTLTADAALTSDLLTMENVAGLSALEPFGADNEKPLFYAEGIAQSITPLSGGKHTRITCDIGGKPFDILKFYTSPDEIPLRSGDLFMAAVSLGINDFRGRKSISMIAEDIMPPSLDQKKYFAANSAFEAFMRSEELPANYYPVMLPNRSTALKIYAGIPETGINSDALYIKIMDEKLNYCRYRTAVEALHELGIIAFSSKDNTLRRIPVRGKNDLSSAPVLKRLSSMIK